MMMVVWCMKCTKKKGILLALISIHEYAPKSSFANEQKKCGIMMTARESA